MKNRKFYFNFFLAGIFAGLFAASTASARDSFVKTTQTLLLGETEIKINIYEKKGASLTFFAPHHNERTGRQIAQELIRKKGGRLIEIESFDEYGNPARQLKFAFQGKFYEIDPNRIYTENGLWCAGISPEITEAVKKFTADLLQIVLAPGGNKLRAGEKILIAVHNNGDVDRHENQHARARDLTASAFSRHGKFFGSLTNFPAQADGVYLSNVEADEDNFFFISTPLFLGFLAEKGFNVVVQKPAAKLKSTSCSVDDGSLSVFAGLRNLPYINVEADAASGGARQLQMLEAIYELLQRMSENESKSAMAFEKSEHAGAIK